MNRIILVKIIKLLDMSWINKYPILSKYPELLNELMCKYSDPPQDKLPDEEYAKLIVEDAPVVRIRVLEQYNSVLSEPNFPWQEISDAANRYFESEKEARLWLTRMYQASKNTTPRYGAFFKYWIPKSAKKVLREKYLYFSDFLITEFSRNISIQKFTDEETARRYALRISQETVSRVIKEGKALLENKDFQWEEINEKANKNYFSEPRDFRQWIINILNILEMISKEKKDKIRDS